MVVTNRGRELGMRLRHVIDDLAQNVKEKYVRPARCDRPNKSAPALAGFHPSKGRF